MPTFTNFIIYLSALVALSSTAQAFFWSTKEAPTVGPQYYYNQRLMQGYGPEAQQLPSIPIQVPLQAQLAPQANVHNVQLVPCLCPVSQDLADYEKVPQQTVVYNPNNVVNHPNNVVNHPNNVVNQQPNGAKQ